MLFFEKKMIKLYKFILILWLITLTIFCIWSFIYVNDRLISSETTIYNYHISVANLTMFPNLTINLSPSNNDSIKLFP